MGLKIETREIDGHTYRVTQINVRALQRVTLWCSKKLASTLDGITDGVGVEAMVIDAIANLAKNLDPSDLDYVHTTFMPNVEVIFDNGKSQSLKDFAVFDQHFEGRLLASLELYAFAMEVNLGDFLGAAADRAKGIIAQAKAKMAAMKAEAEAKKLSSQTT